MSESKLQFVDSYLPQTGHRSHQAQSCDEKQYGCSPNARATQETVECRSRRHAAGMVNFACLRTGSQGDLVIHARGSPDHACTAIISRRGIDAGARRTTGLRASRFRPCGGSNRASSTRSLENGDLVMDLNDFVRTLLQSKE